MPVIDAALLAPLILLVPGVAQLTPAERAEALRLGQGLGCKDSAALAKVSPETVRARRKRIYRKLQIGGRNEILAVLLGVALELLRASPPQATP